MTSNDKLCENGQRCGSSWCERGFKPDFRKFSIESHSRHPGATFWPFLHRMPSVDKMWVRILFENHVLPWFVYLRNFSFNIYLKKVKLSWTGIEPKLLQFLVTCSYPWAIGGYLRGWQNAILNLIICSE